MTPFLLKNNLNIEFLNKQDWFIDMNKTEQDSVHHGEGNVQIHTVNVFNELKKTTSNEYLLLSALFHDIEKRSTTKKEIINGIERITAPKHPKFGEYTTRDILYRYNPIDFVTREKICSLVRNHGMPTWGIEDDDIEKKIIKSSFRVNNNELYLLAKADIMGRICNDQNKLLENLELFKMMCEELECWDHQKSFTNNYSRWKYLNFGGWHNTDHYNDRECTVYMMCGFPGTGKDYYIERNLNLPMVSLDNIRRKHNVKHGDIKGSSLVMSEAKEQCKVYLRKKENFVFNATNLTREIRQKWTSLFNDYKAYIKIIYLEVPYLKLISQNNNREYVVPEEAVNKMITKFEIPLVDECHEIEFLCR
jgi:predicted kinase